MSTPEIAQLYQLLNGPFEQRFDPKGYETNLVLPVDAVRLDQYGRSIDGYVADIIDCGLDTAKPWHAKLGFLASSQSLEYTAIEIPLQSNIPDHRLVLRRVSKSAFLPLSRVGEHEPELFASPLDTGHLLYTASSLLVHTIIEQAGYKLPVIGTEQTDPRQRIAPLMEQAKQWDAHEAKSLSMAGGNLLLQRKIYLLGHHDSEDMQTELSARLSFAHPSRSYRSSTTVKYLGAGFEIGEPTLTKSVLKRDSDIVNDKLPFAYAPAETTDTAPEIDTLDYELAQVQLNADLKVFGIRARRILDQHGFYTPDAG